MKLLQGSGQVPEPKFKRLLVSCQLSVVVGHVVGAHTDHDPVTVIPDVFGREYGFGVCLKECEKAVCQTIGRTSWRARFRKCRTNTIGARTAFFEHHRLGFDTCGDLVDLDENDDASDETGLIPVIIFLRYHSILWKPVDGKMLPQKNGDIQMKTLLFWRAEPSHVKLKFSRALISCIDKCVWPWWTICPQPSALKDDDHANFWC